MFTPKILSRNGLIVVFFCFVLVGQIIYVVDGVFRPREIWENSYMELFLSELDKLSDATGSTGKWDDKQPLKRVASANFVTNSAETSALDIVSTRLKAVNWRQTKKTYQSALATFCKDKFLASVYPVHSTHTVNVTLSLKRFESTQCPEP
jgi:hypothetical protein